MMDIKFNGWQKDWEGKGKNQFLEDLIECAFCALKTENKYLEELFNTNCKSKFYAQFDHSLAYWLYETTLVYLIFKSWIPKCEVVWECPEGWVGDFDEINFTKTNKSADNRYTQMTTKAGKKIIDLVVRNNKNNKEYYGFEAKWWFDNNRKRLEGISNDIEKLNKPELKLTYKYLLLFWYSWSPTWTTKDDEIGINKGIEDVKKKIKKENDVCLIYLNKFDIHMGRKIVPNGKNGEKYKAPDKAYFAMAVLEIN